MKWLQKVTGGYSSSAKVVDGTLILSLPDAVSPVVWRWDLGSVKSSALEVREKGDQFVLMLKTPKGDVSEVAPFVERGRALRALMAVSDAMESAHGELRSAANDETGEPAVAVRRPQGKSNLAAGIIGVVVLVALVAVLVRLSPTGNMMGGEVSAGESAGGEGTSVTGQAATPDATGVPLSADDYLLKRQ